MGWASNSSVQGSTDLAAKFALCQFKTRSKRLKILILHIKAFILHGFFQQGLYLCSPLEKNKHHNG